MTDREREFMEAARPDLTHLTECERAAFKAASAGLTEEERNLLLLEQQQRRSPVMGVMLSFGLGSFGAHHFYLGLWAFGLLFLFFFWTGIPGILGVIQAPVMPWMVRGYNEDLFATIKGEWEWRRNHVISPEDY